MSSWAPSQHIHQGRMLPPAFSCHLTFWGAICCGSNREVVDAIDVLCAAAGFRCRLRPDGDILGIERYAIEGDPEALWSCREWLRTYRDGGRGSRLTGVERYSEVVLMRGDWVVIGRINAMIGNPIGVDMTVGVVRPNTAHGLQRIAFPLLQPDLALGALDAGADMHTETRDWLELLGGLEGVLGGRENDRWQKSKASKHNSDENCQDCLFKMNQRIHWFFLSFPPLH